MKKTLYVIFFIGVLGFIMLTLFLSNFELKNVKHNSKYTVAYITSDWHQKNNNGMGTDFDYFVRNNRISKTCEYNLKKGTKYLVMYDSLKPSNYIMLGHHQLPDDVKSPYDGWNFKQVPIKLDSADLKAYF